MATVQKHSKIIGGSTAKRVINCPGSVAICKHSPKDYGSKYAEMGTLLHDVISNVLDGKPAVIGQKLGSAELTQDIYDDKIKVALDLLDEVDPDKTMEFELEAEVEFALLDGEKEADKMFGSCDLLGRVGNRVVGLDWKFGDGVAVSAEENEQGMYYLAAAMESEKYDWIFDGAEEIEVVIIQPPYIKRWTTDIERLKRFTAELHAAKKMAKKMVKQVDGLVKAHGNKWPEYAEGTQLFLKAGSHCRFCSGKVNCPTMDRGIANAMRIDLEKVDPTKIGVTLHNLEVLENFSTGLRALAHSAMENGIEIPGWKIVNKRATRKWIDETEAEKSVREILSEVEKDAGKIDDTVYAPVELKSPTQMEKELKKLRLAIPDGLVESVSSGTTIAPEDDKREAVQQIASLGNALKSLPQ